MRGRVGLRASGRCAAWRCCMLLSAAVAASAARAAAAARPSERGGGREAGLASSSAYGSFSERGTRHFAEPVAASIRRAAVDRRGAQAHLGHSGALSQKHAAAPSSTLHASTGVALPTGRTPWPAPAFLTRFVHTTWMLACPSRRVGVRSVHCWSRVGRDSVNARASLAIKLFKTRWVWRPCVGERHYPNSPRSLMCVASTQEALESLLTRARYKRRAHLLDRRAALHRPHQLDQLPRA